MKLPTIRRRTIVLSVSFVVLVVGLLLFAHPVWLALGAAWHGLSLAAAWDWYDEYRDDITPLGTFALAAVVAWAASYLEDAHLEGADLCGADLRGTTGLTEAQLAAASGDASTKLPEGVARPAAWPPEKP
jgi:hypothetical protein